MTTLQLPTSFKERIIRTHGDKGRDWLDNLPNIVEACQAKYDIKVNKSLTHLSFNYTVNAVFDNGQNIIVKFCLPGIETCHEIDALNFMRGDGIVRLLNSDREHGILLLEKLQPGKMLLNLSDDTLATQIAAQVMQKIWRPISSNHAFPSTHAWFDRLNLPIDLPSDFPGAFIDKAKSIARDLHQSINASVLLHGDLHHFNILSAQREPWIAIDPKGVVGEREYEVGALLRNPIPDIVESMDTKKTLARRVDILSETLSFDRQKIVGWGFVQAVLAAVWCVDMQSEDWGVFLKCAEALSVLS